VDPNLAATILTELGEKEAAVRHLEEILASTPDEATRAQVKAKLIQLRSRVEAEKMAAEVRTFLDRWRRDFPYLPGDLFVIVGERLPGGSADWRRWADTLAAVSGDNDVFFTPAILIDAGTEVE
jgi:hypothetical protein